VIPLNLHLKLIKQGEVILEKSNIPYQKQENIYKFQFDDMDHIINLDPLEFTRENDEYSFFLNIENKKCEIYLKKEQYYLNVLVEYATLLKNKNVIDLTYYIETDDSETRLLIELESEEI